MPAIGPSPSLATRLFMARSRETPFPLLLLIGRCHGQGTGERSQDAQPC